MKKKKKKHPAMEMEKHCKGGQGETREGEFQKLSEVLNTTLTKESALIIQQE